MVEDKDIHEKKEWNVPVFLELDFKKTLGGETFDTGEDNYVDPVSGL